MSPWVSRLVFVNVLLYILTEAVPPLSATLALVPALVPRQPWTLLTYAFIHGGLWHLGFNMLGLYFFGQRLERQLGGPRFVTLYVVSALGGAALSFATPTAAIVGASAATFGVFLGYVRMWPRERIMIWGVAPVEARVVLLVSTVYAVYGGLGGVGGGIAHYAHLGGYAAAFLFFAWLDLHSPARQWGRRLERALYGDARAAAVPQWQAIRREGLHPMNLEELDRIAAKVQAAGTASLTPDERAFLYRMSLR